MFRHPAPERVWFDRFRGLWPIRSAYVACLFGFNKSSDRHLKLDASCLIVRKDRNPVQESRIDGMLDPELRGKGELLRDPLDLSVLAPDQEFRERSQGGMDGSGSLTKSHSIVEDRLVTTAEFHKIWQRQQPGDQGRPPTATTCVTGSSKSISHFSSGPGSWTSTALSAAASDRHRIFSTAIRRSYRLTEGRAGLRAEHGPDQREWTPFDLRRPPRNRRAVHKPPRWHSPERPQMFRSHSANRLEQRGASSVPVRVPSADGVLANNRLLFGFVETA